MESLVDKFIDHGVLADGVDGGRHWFFKMQMAHTCFQVTLKMVPMRPALTITF